MTYPTRPGSVRMSPGDTTNGHDLGMIINGDLEPMIRCKMTGGPT